MEVSNSGLNNDQVKPQYQFHPLSSITSFRLLELLPGEKSAPISYHLRIADWTRPTLYEAVSYVWGDINRKTVSTCDGLDFMITHNLRDGLAAMRHPNQSRLLWVDAICIDQSNTRERGHQVSHMGDIYRGAARVLVWLGNDENEQGQCSIAAVEEIAARCLGKPIGDLSKEESHLKSRDELWGLLPGHILEGLQCDNDDSWRALFWLFSRPWFCRLWVIQEVVSNQNVEVLCGDSRISWDVVVLTASYIRRHPETYRKWNLDDSFIANAYFMRRRFWLQQVSLPSLLNWGRSFNVTDPKDRVYGLMAMPSFINTGLLWQADYSKLKADLYQDVAYKCIFKTRSLRILCYSQHLDETKIFPSWVPQWDRKACYEAIDESLQKGRWKSSADSKLSADIDLKSGVLKIAGFIVDTVASSRPLFGSMILPKGQVSRDHPLLDFWKEQRQKSSKYLTGETRLEAFSLVITTGLNVGRRKASEAPAEHKGYFGAYLSYLIEATGQTRCETDTLNRDKQEGSWYKYGSLAQAKCQNRSLFFTQTGYMGLGPDIGPGDLVCVFFGGEVPFVLRAKGACYELVGDAYVHGIMEGEAMKMYEAGALREKTFEIY